VWVNISLSRAFVRGSVVLVAAEKRAFTVGLISSDNIMWNGARARTQ